jgi:hypothetical protein
MCKEPESANDVTQTVETIAYLVDRDKRAPGARIPEDLPFVAYAVKFILRYNEVFHPGPWNDGLYSGNP